VVILKNEERHACLTSAQPKHLACFN